MIGPQNNVIKKEKTSDGIDSQVIDTKPKLTLQQLESHLWGAADILRGKIDRSDYKHYIFVLLFY
jgi:type I restriction enzyme M protein